MPFGEIKEVSPPHQIRLDKVHNGYLIWDLQGGKGGEWVSQSLDEALEIMRELMTRKEVS